ncbi:hypothetical protein D0469_16625 [Peribacillus saganii]|uniref:Uncharacterized protein n=1 Tax=Peribacillus saganii TaxID=2303992 RepID=A0A372LK52_9BACI|nr:hypothetical protein D0469_16625 [Peribacillus saganii]
MSALPILLIKYTYEKYKNPDQPRFWFLHVWRFIKNTAYFISLKNSTTMKVFQLSNEVDYIVEPFQVFTLFVPQKWILPTF